MVRLLFSFRSVPFRSVGRRPLCSFKFEVEGGRSKGERGRERSGRQRVRRRPPVVEARWGRGEGGREQRVFHQVLDDGPSLSCTYTHLGMYTQTPNRWPPMWRQLDLPAADSCRSRRSYLADTPLARTHLDALTQTQRE